ERLQAHAAARGGTLMDAIRAVEDVPDIQPRQRKAVRAFADLVGEIAGLPAAPVGPLLHEIVERTGVRQRLRASQDPQDWSRVEHLEALVDGAREFDERWPDRDYRGFLDHAALLAGTDQDKDAPDT